MHPELLPHNDLNMEIAFSKQYWEAAELAFKKRSQELIDSWIIEFCFEEKPKNAT